MWIVICENFVVLVIVVCTCVCTHDSFYTKWNSQSGACQISGYNVYTTEQALIISDSAISFEDLLG